MKRRALLLSLPAVWMTQAQAAEKWPALFKQKELSPVLLAEAVNFYVALGEQKAAQELGAIFPLKEGDHPPMASLPRVAWIAQLLFLPKGKTPLRAARIGTPALAETTIPAKDWPLLPLAQSGDSLFVLTEGYLLGGLPEPIPSYLTYCQKNGVFRKAPLPVPTRAQALQDAASLHESKAWQAMKRKDHGQGFNDEMDEKSSWRFIQDQAERVK